MKNLLIVLALIMGLSCSKDKNINRKLQGTWVEVGGIGRTITFSEMKGDEGVFYTTNPDPSKSQKGGEKYRVYKGKIFGFCGAGSEVKDISKNKLYLGEGSCSFGDEGHYTKR